MLAAAAYPPSSYLIRGAHPRLRVLDDRGRPDVAAIRNAAMLLPVIDVGPAERAAAASALARYSPFTAEQFVAKGAVAFGDMEDMGLLRDVGGLVVVVEHPKGSTRTGKSPDGTQWSTEMTCDYGFFPQTMSVDGEEIDAYVGPDITAPFAYVIAQVREDGTFDEPKVMLGFSSELDAVRAFLSHCPTWCFGGVTSIPVSLIAGFMNIEPITLTQTLKSAGAATATATAPRLKDVLKAAVDTAAIGAGGRVLPTQEPTLDEIKIEGAAWSAADVNDLPDSAFLHIESGGEKDADGRTTPRSLRHFPYKDASGEVDLPHLRNAIAQAPKSNLPESVVAHVQAEGRRILDEHEKTVKAVRVAKAFEQVKGWWASTSHIGQALPLDEAPPDVARAVADSPLTETYPNPDEVGGWLGVIEPADGAWIAFVGMDGRTLLWTEREPDGGVIGMPYYTYRLDLAQVPIADAIMKGFRPIMKFRMQWLGPSADVVPVQKDALSPAMAPARAKRRIVYGVVLEPNPCDGQGDSQGHTYDDEFVRDACHYYSQFRLINLDHKGAPIDPARARVVEQYIAPCDFVLDTPRGPQNVKKGSWVMATEILDEELWARVERGDWQAYSVEGFSRSVAIESSHWNVRHMQCRHCSTPWRASVAKDRPFPPELECPRCHRMSPSAPN